MLLGVDGGGTATEAWLGEPGLRVIGRGTAGPSNAKAVGLDAARQALDAAIGAAFQDAGLEPAPVEAACLGLAGFDRPDDRKILIGWADEARLAHRLVLVNDGDLVVAAGTPEGWGVGVIAGTGSIAVGRTPDGRTARRGLGAPHRRRGERLCRRPGRPPPGRPPRRRPRTTPDWPRPAHRSTLPGAGRGPAVPDRDGDLRARLQPRPTRRAGPRGPGGLRRVARGRSPAADTRRCRARRDVAAVARSLGWPCGGLPLAAAGGFLLSATAVRQAMLDGLAERGYQPALTLVTDPVRGALILAERAMNASEH